MRRVPRLINEAAGESVALENNADGGAHAIHKLYRFWLVRERLSSAFRRSIIRGNDQGENNMRVCHVACESARLSMLLRCTRVYLGVDWRFYLEAPGDVIVGTVPSV